MSIMKSSETDRPILYTTEQTAELFNIDKYTLRNWIKEGKIPAYKVGHRWLFKESEVLELLNKSKVEPKI